MAVPDAVASEFNDWFDYARGLFTTDVASHRGDEVPQTCWASAQEYRHILFTAGRHEGRAAERYLERVPDPHLRLFAQIELAAALTGLPRISGIVVGSRGQASHESARRLGTAATGAGRAAAVRVTLAAALARRQSGLLRGAVLRAASHNPQIYKQSRHGGVAKPSFIPSIVVIPSILWNCASRICGGVG